MGIDARIYAVTAKDSKKLAPDEVWHLGYEIGFCRVPMTQYGWRGGQQPGGKYVCHGCGAKRSSEDGRTFAAYEELKYRSAPVNEILHAVQSFLGKWRGKGCNAPGDLKALHARIDEVVKEHEAEFKKDLEF